MHGRAGPERKEAPPQRRIGAVVWGLLFLVAVAGILAEAALPYLPGDVAVARAVQAALPPGPDWAQAVSASAQWPWTGALILVAAAFGWALRGSRAAILAVVSYIGIWALDQGLRLVLVQPRPSPDLVRVVGHPPGSGFPSTFALVYAGTVGFVAVLALTTGRAPWRTLLIATCTVLLLVGFGARVALGAHWPSDVLLSYLLGLLWASALLAFERTAGRGSTEPPV
jgi:membrane-associated phospholipid phosphatase